MGRERGGWEGPFSRSKRTSAHASLLFPSSIASRALSITRSLASGLVIKRQRRNLLGEGAKNGRASASSSMNYPPPPPIECASPTLFAFKRGCEMRGESVQKKARHNRGRLLGRPYPYQNYPWLFLTSDRKEVDSYHYELGHWKCTRKKRVIAIRQSHLFLGFRNPVHTERKGALSSLILTMGQKNKNS